jgi:cytochrome c
MRSLARLAGFGALFAVAGAASAAGQLPTYGVGRAPTAEEVTAWDLTIPPDGQGLPSGRGTAALGQPIYAERCASCHGEKGEDPKYSRLVGGHGSLVTAEPIRTIGSFWQYATTLWSYIRRAQPFDEPGSLTSGQVYAVTAYLLYLNGIVGENDILDARSLPQVKMPNRDGFVPDARPDVGKKKR